MQISGVNLLKTVGWFSLCLAADAVQSASLFLHMLLFQLGWRSCLRCVMGCIVSIHHVLRVCPVRVVSATIYCEYLAMSFVVFVFGRSPRMDVCQMFSEPFNDTVFDSEVCLATSCGVLCPYISECLRWRGDRTLVWSQLIHDLGNSFLTPAWLCFV